MWLFVTFGITDTLAALQLLLFSCKKQMGNFMEPNDRVLVTTSYRTHSFRASSHDDSYTVERAESAQDLRENCGIYPLRLILNLLHQSCSLLEGSVRITEENDKAIFATMKATYKIFEKLPQSCNAYHKLLKHSLCSMSLVTSSTPTRISSKYQRKGSIHGVLHNLAIKLAGEVFDLLGFFDGNFENSKLGPLLESLNCTLGSLNRVLDPLPGGEYAMEAELYNAHLTHHTLPIVQSRISEPVVSYCCCSYKQLTLR